MRFPMRSIISQSVVLPAPAEGLSNPLGSIGALASQYTLHGYETVLELSYQAQALPWLQVQPDIQYVIDPGGGIPDPSRPGQRVGSAAVFGLRIVAAF
jgi:carbohydrate-selective porin OprB